MLKSMISSVSGLRAQQTKMDVIGNNIANVNTIGYWGSRVTFQEVLNQTLKSATGPDPITGRGGTNPMQVGLGTTVGAIDMNTNTGGIQRTDNPFDLSIEGSGFFIARGSEGEEFMFTRAGNLRFDQEGNLITANGMRVYGWLDYGGKASSDGTYIFDIDKDIEPINIFSDQYNGNKKTIAPKATTQAVLAGNLDSSNPVCQVTDPPQVIVPVTVYDSLGNAYQLEVEFRKTAVNATDPVNTEWTWSIPNGDGFSSGSTGRIRFDSNGNIMTNDPVNFNVTPTITVIPDPTTTGTTSFTINLDFSKISMFATGSSVKATNVDGYPAGSFVSCSIGSDGVIMGVYSNGKQQPLGLIALAVFENPAGLEKVGNNMFVATPNSGAFSKAVKPGMNGAGVLNPGTLELSNVDLATEFTEMIITQRAFQANSRVITVSDEMLMELANLKR